MACLQVQRTFVDESLVESLYFGLNERERDRKVGTDWNLQLKLTEVDNYSVSKEAHVKYTYSSGFDVFSSLVLQ